MRRLLLLLTLAALTATGCSLPGHARSHQEIGARADTLRAAFNADAADTRVLALVSPTCGTCLLGATTMQHDVFAKISSIRLRGFIVWVPKLGAHQHDVAAATPTVPDLRATQYWDGTGYLVHAYAAVLGLDADAWDVYLIYPPGVRWTAAAPPRPSYWMQQLTHASQPDGNGAWLNGHTFAVHVRTTLKTVSHAAGLARSAVRTLTSRCLRRPGHYHGGQPWALLLHRPTSFSGRRLGLRYERAPTLAASRRETP